MAILGLRAGVDWHQPIHLTDASGAVINLTGATGIHCIIYQGKDTIVFDLEVGVGLVVVTAATGHIRLDLTPDDTRGLEGDYLFEVYGTLASGDLNILSKGELHIYGTYVGL